MDIPPTFRAARDCDGHAQIGLTRHALRGIRYAEGEGGGTGTEGQQGGQEGQGGQGGPEGQGGGQEGQQQGTEGQQGGAPDFTGWPQAAIDAYNKRDSDAKRYQREAGDSRMNAKAGAREEGKNEGMTEERKTLLRALAPILGIDLPTDEATDPAKLTEQLTGATEKIGALSTENVVLRQAIAAGIQADKVDYLEFTLSRNAEFQALDRSATDYSARVRAAIDAAASADRSLVQSGTTTTSGPESFGGANGGGAITQEAFNAMSMAERSTLYKTDKPTYDRLSAGVSR